jgi:hypothetical protein
MAKTQPTVRPRLKLRTIEDLRVAYEDLYNRQNAGELDAKTSDGLNTTLKGSTYLNVKIPMDGAKLFVQAAMKKIDLPVSLRKVLPIPFWLTGDEDEPAKFDVPDKTGEKEEE